MKSSLTNRQKSPQRRSARIVFPLFAGLFASLMLAALATFTLRSVNADAFSAWGGKFGIAEQSRAGKLLKHIGPKAFNPAVAPAAPFAVYTVNSLDDTNTGSGTSGTLRYCITQANAASGADTINFSVNGTITLTGNLPNITDSLTINGNGTANTIISGNNLYRSINSIQADGITVTIQNLQATNGFVAGTGFGGAIDINSTGGTLTVNNVLFQNGTAGYGGAINADAGTLNLNNCVFSLNTSNTSGGALWLGSSPAVTTTLVNCVIKGNQGPAGGIHSNGGVLNIYNSTISGNTNTSNSAVRNNGGTLNLRNSIIANSTGGSGDCSITPGTTVQNSLIEDGSCGIANGVNGNLTGDPALNPDLTPTSASIAVGTGNNSLIPSGVTTDLAGNARIQQGVVDMGAYESTFAGIVPVLGNYPATTVNLGGQATVTPSTAPTDAGNLVVKASSGFNGTFYANPATGVVKIINAHPAGTYTITVTSFRPAGSASKTFTLTVQSGSACATTPLFSSAPNFTVGSPSGITVGDFNNDGMQDLAISNSNSATVSIRLGDGAGGFTGTTTVSTNSSPIGSAVGDFNGDGNQDLAVACGGGVSIRQGDGAGNFSGSTNVPIGGSLVAIAVGDFNGDGKLDFITTNFDTGRVYVRQGDGAGGFSGTTNISVGTSPNRIAAGDFNNDGNLDFATANGNANTVSIRLGDGAGNFSGTTEITAGANPQGLALGDFNKDSQPDLAIVNYGPGTTFIRLGDGLGDFSGTTNLTTTPNPSIVVVGDFNNDGNPDIAVVKSGAIDYRLGNGLGGFGTTTNLTITNLAGGSSFALGDFNGDGRQDLVAADSSSGTVQVRLGGCNVAPNITAGGPLTRQQGSAGSSATIATVSDTETVVGSLTVTATTVPTGITVTGISNSGGAVTATVAADCTAAIGANTVVLTVTDGNGATNTANLTVNVTANSAPTISYSNASVNAGSGTTVNPATGPGDNGSITGIVVQSVTPSTSPATITIHNSTGVVTVPNNVPVGSYTVTIRATDNCGAFTDASFTLTVSNTAPTFTPAAAISRQQGASPGAAVTVGTVADGQTAAGSLVVTQIAGGTATGITVTGITNTGGTITAVVTADCTATPGTVRFQVTDGSLTGTGDLQVNVTAATPPTTAAAGQDQTLCATAPATLAANPPSVGTGAWSVVSGPSLSTAQFNSLTNSAATFTPAGGVGAYTLRWTITGACATSTDDVVLTYNANPTTANAGPDQTVCATSATLAANTPTVGTGAWSIVSGTGGTITTPSSPTSGFTGVAGTTYTLRWTISNSPCTASTDDVVITLTANPTMAAAGMDQAFCGTSAATLAANAPTIGTGAWTVVSGPSTSTAQFSSTSSPTATFTPAGGTGVYTLRWTISNAPCTASTDDVVLTYNAVPTITLGASPSVLPGATGANLPYSATTGSPNQYSIDYNAAANTAGFVDVVNATLPASPIALVVPGAAASGTYNATLTVRNSATGCVSSSPAFTVTISSCPSLFTVNDLGDAADASAGNGVCATAGGVCTLRAAIQEANALTSCSPMTINFSVAGTINLGSVLPDLNHPNLTINNGADPTQLTVRRDTGGNYRIFTIATGRTVTINGLTMRDGDVGSGSGGGIYNSNGTLTLNDCVVSNNIAGDTGAGIAQAFGTTTINRSTIADNTLVTGTSTVVNGAGMYINQGTVTLNTTTFSGNRKNDAFPASIQGAALVINDATVSATNCTFSNNTGRQIIGNFATIQPNSLTLLNCTISNNTLNSPGVAFGAVDTVGISAGATATTIVKNTIVAGNPGNGTAFRVFANGFSTLTSQGNNLCGDASLTPTASGDLTNANPLLAALGNYGGLTQTHALLPGSPAINAGTATGAPTTDQRGIARVGGTDIGAFESRGFTLTVAGGNNQSAVTSLAFASPLSVTVSSANGEPVNGGQVTFTPPGAGASCTLGTNPATITGGTASSTATANAVIGGPYTVSAAANGATAISFSLTNLNSAPTFTPAAAISRQQGTPAGAAVTIGTVADAQTAAGSLTVTPIAGGTATGINVTGISNNDGTITAIVSADCTATAGTVRFQVSDGAVTGTGDLTVNVTANTAPAVTYANVSVNAGASTTNTTTTATDNGSISSFAVQSQGSYTGTISVSASGVVSISNAAPVGAHTITIRATDNCGATTDATFTLTVGNNLPTITAGAALARQRGTAGTVSTMATVSDGETPVGSLVVTATTVPAGITITGISNTAGTITATVAADCTATLGANTVVLTVTDGNGGTATANLTVNVTANTAPAVTYANVSVNAGASTTNAPTTATDNGSITGYAVQSQGSYTGTISVSASGVVSISNAAPVGAHTITIRATDNCGATTDATFTLTIGNNLPTITPGVALARQQGSAGSVSAIATVSDNDTPLGNLVVTATSLPTGITVTSITNTNGAITANVAAGCNASVGANIIVLTVTDADGGTATASLTVNVTANTAPALAYPASEVAQNTATTINPTAAADNGSITGYQIVSVVPPLTVAPTVNASGVVSVTDAGPFGSHIITVKATDNCGLTTDATFTLNVGCGTITVNPATLINGLTFVAYSSTLSATGGTGSFTFSLTSGTLPAGLSLSGNTISGTPNTAGASTFTIRATDDNGCIGERSYTLLIGSTGLMYYPLARPVRLLDTRPGASANACFQPNAPIPGGTSRLQPARGVCEGLTIPPSATTITGNITTVQSGGGFLAIYPSDAPQPLVANSNYLPNEIVNNSFTVGVGAADGAVKISVTTDTDVVVDVTGYYAPPEAANPGGLYFHPLPRPVRLLETRQGFTGCFAPGTPLQGGVNTTQQGTGSCQGLTIPSEALALVGNATTVDPSALGYLTLYPADAAQPLIASSNYGAGQTVNGPFTVGLAPSGQFNIFAQQTTDLVIDITGYYSAQANDANGQGLLYSSLGSPLRLLDTRAGQQGCYTPGAAMVGGVVYTQETQSPCTNLTPTARALIGNATTVNTTGVGYLTFWPGDAQQPLVATSNFTGGQVINRYFTVGLGPDGSFKRFASRTTDLVVDISGFFAP